ncbi:uncharacterized protein LOC135216728 isoform X3 [Macrobrachium nipponense]|uniref:uncharacterized protein LOC135216728 isoform X3 n=1 Tax=Macrobrachium nipponense TaxID=159736 RepID=UPI0030C81098
MNDRILLLIGFIIIQNFATTVDLQETLEDKPWINIRKFLINITHDYLSANELQRELRDRCTTDSKEVDGTTLLNEIMRDFKNALQSSISTLKKLKQVIEDQHDNMEAKPRNQATSNNLCCESGYKVNEGCAVLPSPARNDSDLVKAPFIPQSVISEFTRSARLTKRKIVHYVSFNDGSVYMHPPSINPSNTSACTNYDPRRRYFYTQTKSPGARELVIVIDRRENTSTKVLVEVVRKIFNTLRPTDKVALCLPYQNICKTEHLEHTKKNTWSMQNHPLTNWTLSGHTVLASHINIERINSSFIDWLKPKVEDTYIINNYTTTLASASDLLNQDSSCRSCQMIKGKYCQILVLVTPEGESSKWNSSEVFDHIRKSSVSIVFRHFKAMPSIIADDTISYSNSDESDLFCHQSVPGSNNPVVLMPYVDGFGMGYIMSICLPLTKGSDFLGVVCSDLNFVNLEAKISVEGIKDAYVFMVNSFGYTLTHPLLPPPYRITKDLTYVDIHKLEPAAQVESILDSIIRHSSGSQDSVEAGLNLVQCSTVEGVEIKSVGRPSSSDIPGIVKLFNKTLQYCWAPINQTDLTIVIVLPQNDSKAYLPLCKGYQPQGLPAFKYHLQTNHSERNCSEGGEPREGFVKFAPDCFLDMLSYVQNGSFSMSEISDIFSGEKPSQEVMRKDLYGSVKLLRKADQLWREIDRPGNLSCVRYMGTADGVFISFPGKVLHQAYDHRNTPWYRRAVSFQQKELIAMTTPHCSEFGGRTLYTITQTLYDKYDNPVAVVAGDFPAQHILDEFKSKFPFCKKSICILVDSLGYVVLKSDWEYTESCNKDTEIVAAHITRVAPDLALNMISKYLLQRRACHDYEENLTFYYWSFALKGRDTVYKAPTSIYTVYKIAQTNLHLIVRGNGASDRSCNCDPFKKGSSLECHDTCAVECECPCKAGSNTVPCHNADQDVHRYPIPACKPLGFIEDISKCSLNKTFPTVETPPGGRDTGQ